MSFPAKNLLFNQTKAGLNNVNYNEISNKIAEVSKDTRYFAYQKERSKTIDSQIDDLKIKLRFATKFQLDIAQSQADALICKFEKKRMNDQIYFHADLDAFFASVEEIDDPTLKGTAFIVADKSGRGVVSTSSYEARKFGVRSGMAVFIALSLCPNIRIVDHHGDRYVEMSKMVQSVFALYDPHFTSFGLDEATMNFTDYLKTNEIDPINAAKDLQTKVVEKTGLTISIGIAPSPQLSKIASDINKPNGVYQVSSEVEPMIEFIRSLSVRKIPGVGGVTERKLQELNFQTMGDIIDRRGQIMLLFSKTFCNFIFSSAVGLSYVPKMNEDRKSISKQQTFEPTDDIVKLMEIIENLSDKLTTKLQRGGIGCKTVTVKFKSTDFQVISHCHTFDVHTFNISDINNAAIKLLMDENRRARMKLRLVGVGVSNLLYPGQARQKTINDWVIKGFTEPQNGLESEPNVFPSIDDQKNSPYENVEKKMTGKKNEKKGKVIEKYFKGMYESVTLNTDPEQPSIDMSTDWIKRPKTQHGTYSIGSFFGCENLVPKHNKNMKTKKLLTKKMNNGKI